MKPINDALFDTKEKREGAIATFRSLMDHPGWQLVQKILDGNIRVLKDQLLDGVEDETKVTIDVLRDKLRAYQDVRNTPENMIDKLTDEDTSPDLEIYDTAEDIQKRKTGAN